MSEHDFDGGADMLNVDVIDDFVDPDLVIDPEFQESRLLPPPPEGLGLNRAGGWAFEMSHAAKLMQYCVCGTLSDQHYVGKEALTDELTALLEPADPEFLSKAVVYSARIAKLREVPASILAWMVVNRPKEFNAIWRLVLHNGTMVRKFVNHYRKQTKRKSLPMWGRRAFRDWILERDPFILWQERIGNDPAIKGLLWEMGICAPNDPTKDAVIGLIHKRFIRLKPEKQRALPERIQQYERWKRLKLQREPVDPNQFPIGVDFRSMDAVGLTDEEWLKIGLNAPYGMLIKNLNNWVKHNPSPEVLEKFGNRIMDPQLIRKSKQFPYAIMTAWLNHDGPLKTHLEFAMETAIQNVPRIEGPLWVLLDVSGSMSCALTRRKVDSKIRCVDCAGLMAATLIRRSGANVIPFDTRVHEARMKGDESVLKTADRLARYGGGGTDCAVGMRSVVDRIITGMEIPTAVIFLSDNESWMQSDPSYMGSRYNPNTGRYEQTTGVHHLYQELKDLAREAKRPIPKLICHDLQVGGTSQSNEAVHIGGFADGVWDLYKTCIEGDETMIDTIMRINLDGSDKKS